MPQQFYNQLEDYDHAEMKAAPLDKLVLKVKQVGLYKTIYIQQNIYYPIMLEAEVLFIYMYIKVVLGLPVIFQINHYLLEGS